MLYFSAAIMPFYLSLYLYTFLTFYYIDKAMLQQAPLNRILIPEIWRYTNKYYYYYYYWLGIVIPARTKCPSTNLYHSEFHLLALFDVAFWLHHLAKVEEHARVLVGAPDEPERVLHRRDDPLQHTALHVERNKPKWTHFPSTLISTNTQVWKESRDLQVRDAATDRQEIQRHPAG